MQQRRLLVDRFVRLETFQLGLPYGGSNQTVAEAVCDERVHPRAIVDAQLPLGVRITGMAFLASVLPLA
jgi:hypothetical protein